MIPDPTLFTVKLEVDSVILPIPIIPEVFTNFAVAFVLLIWVIVTPAFRNVEGTVLPRPTTISFEGVNIGFGLNVTMLPLPSVKTGLYAVKTPASVTNCALCMTNLRSSY